MGQGRDAFPALQTASAEAVLYKYQNFASILKWHIGLSYLESGRIKSAQTAFEECLVLDPDSALRPLVAFYLTQITDQEIDAISPSERIPVSPDMFSPSVDDEAGAE